MKSFTLLSIALCATAFMACNGGGSQQQATVPAQQQQMSAQAQQPATPQASVSAQAAPVAQPQALPEAVTAFLNKNFPGTTVVGVETDTEYGGLEYDVLLSDGTKVDFDRNNQWESIDCRGKAVPAALVPAAIASYVQANYQALPITKIDHQPYGYDLDLSNGLELKFNSSGQFIGLDD